MMRLSVPKRASIWQGVIATLLLTFISAALAQEVSLPQRSTSFEVAPVGDSGLSGKLYVGEYAEDLSVVVLELDGTSAGDAHPSHLHTGDCGSGGGVEIPLADVAGDTGLGVTMIHLPFDELLAQDFHVNAHLSAGQMGTIVACGEVGGDARTAAAGAPAGDAGSEAPADATQAQTSAAEQEAQTGLRSESYQLFAIQSSGVSGTLNVTEEVGGGTTFVVTGVGINPGAIYQPVLFAGDCGPDRERIAELAPIGGIPEDPFASISEVSMSFEEVAQGDYFLYIYPEGGQGEPLACGEVGVGANR